MTICYIGMFLKAHGCVPPPAVDLIPRLRNKYRIVASSSVRSKTLRAIDIIITIVRHRTKAACIIIDTYSTYGFYYALVAAMVSRILRIPYIPVLHGGALPRRLAGTPQLAQIVFKKASYLVSPSRYLYEHFLRSGYEQTVLIHNAIDVGSYLWRRRSKAMPRLLWVRTVHRDYNPKMALRVMARLRERFDDAYLCMVGPHRDDSIDECRQLSVEWHLEECVSFTGMLPKRDWAVLSDAYDIFINTTHYDNHPVSVIEAMALGLPVVSTNVGGLSFMLQDGVNAMLVDDNDDEAMFRAVERLIMEPELVSRLSIAGREEVQKYSWTTVQDQWYNLIDSVACR